ncbi:MAG: hypothetical protein LLF80_03325 [Porphyromonadaceae bacterium]|nr:hypothetical protein [Porphyromonadaceae bacterium]
MMKGGWPAFIDVPLEEALLLNRGYVDLLADIDMSRVSNRRRDPGKVRVLLRSIARNISTLVDRWCQRDFYCFIGRIVELQTLP